MNNKIGLQIQNLIPVIDNRPPVIIKQRNIIRTVFAGDLYVFRNQIT